MQIDVKRLRELMNAAAGEYEEIDGGFVVSITHRNTIARACLQKEVMKAFPELLRVYEAAAPTLTGT